MLALRESPATYSGGPRLLDRVRHAIRARHYSHRTEKAYVGWIKRYIFFHGKRHPADMGAAEVSRFLTALASFLLSERLFYRQALQVLRGYLEELVLPLHFLDHPEHFARWKVGNFYVPPLRDRKKEPGLLTQLNKAGLLPEPVAQETAELYGELNGAVHAAAEAMIHRGTDTGRYFGHIFKYSDFCVWANLLARSVKVAVALLRVNIVSWQARQIPGRFYCDICYSSLSEPISEIRPDGFQRLRCRQCGRKLLFRVAKATDET